jgi:hypothetical protein
MTKEEFRKHCEKQIEMCIKLHDAKHLREHELALGLLNENERLIQQKNEYKEVINKLRELIGKHYFKQSDDYYDYFTEGVCLQDGDYQELEALLKEVG